MKYIVHISKHQVPSPYPREKLLHNGEVPLESNWFIFMCFLIKILLNSQICSPVSQQAKNMLLTRVGLR